MTKKLKSYILHLHNYYRNLVAGGMEITTKTNQKYPIALRMRRMIWDDELSYVAHFHAAQVKFGHDKCRNTLMHQHSGQNLGFMGSQYISSVIDVINNSLTQMYNEKNLLSETTGVIAKLTMEYVSFILSVFILYFFHYLFVHHHHLLALFPHWVRSGFDIVRCHSLLSLTIPKNKLIVFYPYSQT